MGWLFLGLVTEVGSPQQDCSLRMRISNGSRKKDEAVSSVVTTAYPRTCRRVIPRSIMIYRTHLPLTIHWSEYFAKAILSCNSGPGGIWPEEIIKLEAQFGVQSWRCGMEC